MPSPNPESASSGLRYRDGTLIQCFSESLTSEAGGAESVLGPELHFVESVWFHGSAAYMPYDLIIILFHH